MTVNFAGGTFLSLFDKCPAITKLHVGKLCNVPHFAPGDIVMFIGRHPMLRTLGYGCWKLCARPGWSVVKDKAKQMCIKVQPEFDELSEMVHSDNGCASLRLRSTTLADIMAACTPVASGCDAQACPSLARSPR